MVNIIYDEIIYDEIILCINIVIYQWFAVIIYFHYS